MIERILDEYCQNVQDCASHFGVPLSNVRVAIEPFYISRRIRNAPNGTEEEKRIMVAYGEARGKALVAGYTTTAAIAATVGTGLVFLLWKL